MLCLGDLVIYIKIYNEKIWFSNIKRNLHTLMIMNMILRTEIFSFLSNAPNLQNSYVKSILQYLSN